MAEKISLRKTGLVVFGGRLFSVFTGLLFLVMVTRSLTPASFGLWEFTYDLVSFSTFPAAVAAFWVTRRVARGAPVGRTALALGALLTLVGVVFFLAVALALHADIGAAFSHFLVAVVNVPFAYWSVSAVGVAFGGRPSAVGYSLFVSETSKIAAAYYLLYLHPIGVDGVFVALEVAYLVQAACVTYLCRDLFGGKVDLAEARGWVLGSWIPFVDTLTPMILLADTFVGSLVFSGTTVVGFYQAAFAVGNLVGYSGYLSIALYPILLRTQKGRVSSLALDFSLLFGLPMAAGAIALSRPALYLLKPEYTADWLGLSIIAVSALVYSFSGILDSTLFGLESADVDRGPGKGSFWGTALVFVPVVNLLGAVGYIGGVYAALRLTAGALPNPAPIVAAWGVVQLSANSAVVLVKSAKVRKAHALTLPRSLPKYVLGSAVAAAVAYLLEPSVLDYGAGAVEFGLRLGGIVVVAGAVYFGLLYAIDGRFRALAGRVLSVLRREPQDGDAPQAQSESLAEAGSPSAPE